ncbi:RHS repeat-associated core domain-containing protein [Pseudomonas japonica]|uniref:RHS repeat-associated core domain-containing protein n=1 Tax=Pseudomonas japonica TaxID=256466 RepID=A0A239BYD1_9PSED|nr:RHS repeat-associated core domain-containing protein [Pseudomonas japonica]SNS12143.1 RHS repeat-associated core domain-containing protein [Pseudomonas japonica]
MKRNWKDLGEVWSGRDLAAGEEVTLNVFDKSLGILLEQIPFRPSRNRRTRHLWVKDFCLYINAHSALIHAGEENAAGDWDVICSRYRNHYRNLTTRELVVTTTVPSVWNWSSDRCVPLKATQERPAGTRMRVNVRTATGVLLETITLTLERSGIDEWPQDLAARINAVSRFVRAGCANGESIEPQAGATANFIWLPHNGDFEVSWFSEVLSTTSPIEADRDARQGERLSVFVFDNIAERLIERTTLVAGVDGARLGLAQWPADLAHKINASSQYLEAGVLSDESFAPPQDASENAFGQYGKQLFTCSALANMKGWTRAKEMVSSVDLKPHERVQVKVTTRGKGNLCETLTFTPDPSRLKAGQWHHDLARYINAQGLCLRAGVKDDASKTFVAKEDSKGNSFWLPLWSTDLLDVNMATVSLKEVGYISAERDLDPGEGCTAYVLDDTSEDVLEEIEFTPAAKRNGSSLAPNDLAERINSRTQLIAAGEKKSNEAPLPIASGYRNALWACDPNVRAFTTFMSLKNWVKGPALGSKDFESNQQMVIRVRGSKTGRILESQVFWPRAGRLDLQAWTRDLCSQVNSFCRFLRAGEGNATSFVIAASDSRDGNCFWTPAGSGLVVEAEILSGFRFVARQLHGHKVDQEEDDPVELAGMSSEEKQLFDQYAEAGRLIAVDARSGLPTLQIPVGELYADDSLSSPLEVHLSYHPKDGVFIQCGYSNRYLPWAGDQLVATLRDGRRVQIDLEVKPVNGGDFKIEPLFNIGMAPLEKKIIGFTVMYNDGGEDTFKFFTTSKEGARALLTGFRAPSGQYLQLDYSGWQLEKISRDKETLLQVTWGDDPLKDVSGSLVMYPGSSTEKRTWGFIRQKLGDMETKIQVDGFGTTGKTLYVIKQNSSDVLISVAMEHQHAFGSEISKAIHEEILEYESSGKISRHVICPGAGLEDLVHEYTYSDTESELTGYFKTTTPKAVFTRTHHFADGQSSEEKYGSTAVPISCTKNHSFDETKKCLVSSTKVWEGDVLVDDQVMNINGIGNPISRTDNGETRYYTYYNNYQQFEVEEIKEKVQDRGLFGILFGALDYINPVGWGMLADGSGGVTWGTYIKTKVNMVPATNDYAKKAFNLPVDIVHCGSDTTFNGDVESELVTRKVNGAEHPQRLTFFGYAKFGNRVRVNKKLTILQPDSVEADIEAEQLACAKGAAKAFLASLDEQIKQASGADKTGYEQTKAALLKSLVAQSKENKFGYKLQSWKAASMFVETLEYHTDAAKPGFGTLKSLKTELLDKDGKVIDKSARTTTYGYAQDSADANRLVITTTVSATGETDIVSSQTRSRLTGRIYESLDSEGIKTVYTYDPQGNMASETVSKGDTEQRKTTHTLVSGLESQFELVQDGVTSRLLKDVHGRRKTMWLKPSGATSFLETQSWEYDKIGRPGKSVETDYGKDNKKVSERHTSWSYDLSTGKISISNVLKDGSGKEVKTTLQSVEPTVQGETFVQGTFSVERQFDSTKKYLTEHYKTGSENSCKIERNVAEDGLLASVRYLTIDKAGKETEHDKVTYEYDQYAQLSKASPKEGTASSYTYDCAGRLASTSREGVALSNGYAAASLAPVASTGQVDNGKDALLLGQQTVDMLGRVSSQTVNQSATEFSYTGGSRRSTLKSPGSAPGVLKGYSSSADEKTRTHTQTVTVDDTALASTLVFSTSGRLLSFKDLSGSTSSYEYDFFNRVTRSVSDHCECHFTYGDNGLLSSESIKAMNADNLTMKVSYSYDELGQEIERTFTCEGVETLSLERTLRADGRLAKSTLKKAGKDEFSDSYEYDVFLRLKAARGGMGLDRFAYDMLGNMIHGNLHAFWYDEDTGLPSKVEQIVIGTERPDDTSFDFMTHDASGRLTEGGWRKVSYHGNGQIDTYSYGGDSNTYTFSYDSDGRVRGGTIGKKSDTYFYRGDCVYALKQSDSDKTDGFAKRMMILRNESRACLLQDAETDGKSRRSFELRDAQGTVFASVDLASKAIVLFRYSPYGMRYAGSKADNWLGFKGEPLNSMGFYYLGNGYRAYDPAWGRFLTRDSMSPFGAGGAAGYVYCNGDPVNNHDPSGHKLVAQYERWGTMPIVQTTAFRIVVGAVGVLLAPFTAGTSMLLAIATTALAAISFALDVASIIISESDPELARTLETWGQAFAIAGAAAGISMTLNGLKGIPRNMFKVRGGLPTSKLVKLIRTPAELSHAQHVRSKALSGLIRGAEEAKAAGTYDAFKATYFHPEAGSVSAVVPAGASGARLTQRVGNTAKNLVTGIISQVDDSAWDALGTVLDLNSGPNTLVQKFLEPPPGETTLVSIVAGPIAGREKLFP